MTDFAAMNDRELDAWLTLEVRGIKRKPHKWFVALPYTTSLDAVWRDLVPQVEERGLFVNVSRDNSRWDVWLCDSNEHALGQAYASTMPRACCEAIAQALEVNP